MQSLSIKCATNAYFTHIMPDLCLEAVFLLKDLLENTGNFNSRQALENSFRKFFWLTCFPRRRPFTFLEALERCLQQVLLEWW